MTRELVQDWMSRDLVTIGPDTTLPDALRLMQEHCIRHLLVVEDGKLVGIVTWGDIRGASASDATLLSIYELNALLDSLCVNYIMSRNPISVHPRTSIARAAQIMMEKKIGCLPVIKRDKVEGIITESDILRILVLGRAA